MNLTPEEIGLVSQYLGARQEVKDLLFTLDKVLTTPKKPRSAFKADGTPRGRPGRKPKLQAIAEAA